VQKLLRASGGEGEKITLYRAGDDRAEARVIAETIRKTCGAEGFGYGDFAVLYRTNAQSRVIEEVLKVEGLPYRLIGALSFYRRKEIKDLLAYLKVIVNPSDSFNLLRIINCPPRGIGKKGVDSLVEYADSRGITLFEALTDPPTGEPGGGRWDRLRAFAVLLSELKELAGKEDLVTTIRLVLERSGYGDHLRSEGTVETLDRLENIEEFVRSAEEYARAEILQGRNARVGEFLERTSLMEDTNSQPSASGVISLLTLHNAKGLEFPFVFITGMEEGLLPWGGGDMEDREEIEEERRLLYVGMTRAMTHLHLSHALERMNHGKRIRTMPSRFIREIPAGLMREISASRIGPYTRTSFWVQQEATVDWSSEGEFTSHGDGAFHIGERIFHRHFGGGVVIGTDGQGERLKLTVDFDDWGVKKLYPRFADLRREDESEGGAHG